MPCIWRQGTPFRWSQCSECAVGAPWIQTRCVRHTHASARNAVVHTEYLLKNLSHVMLANEIEKVTYCEALEMSGTKAPSSPRERNLLNIMSYHSDSMASSLLVLDKSQAINRTQMCPAYIPFKPGNFFNGETCPT